MGTLFPDSSAVDRMRDALVAGNIPAMLMVLRQLTGDDHWLAEPFAPRRAVGLDDNDSGGLPPEIQSQIRRALLAALVEYDEGRLTPSHPTDDEIAKMLGVALCQNVPAAYGRLLSEELALTSREVKIPRTDDGQVPDVLVIGAGLSGLCAGIRLAEQGIPFRILEKNQDIGGTWLENIYPGVGVDTPSHLYSFSFAMNPEWPRYFARGESVETYLHSLVEKYNLLEHIHFGVEVEHASWDEEAARWRVRTTDGVEWDSTILVSAVGMVNRPSLPDIPGLDSFEGPVMHTAEWDPSVDLDGKRVVVVGTGASAMQLVPTIAGGPSRITIFQRSRQWAVPHPNYHREVDEQVQFLMRTVPFYLAWYRLRAFWNFSDRLHASIQVDPSWPNQSTSINASNERHRRFLTDYIVEQLGDRDDLIAASVPDYPPYGKRPLIDNGWYRTLLREEVELIESRVTEVRAHSVVDGTGREVDADAIILATGFKAIQLLYPMDVRGRSGRTLRGQVWESDDARAYLGMVVPDYPNLFILNGPNTNAGHGGSAIHPTEFQVRYLMQAIAHLVEHPDERLEVLDDVYERYNAELDEALSRTVWAHPGMTTYYRNAAGRIVVSSPWTYLDYWQRTAQFDPADYASFAVQGAERVG